MKFFILIMQLLLIQIVIAGDGKGSGGDAIECLNEAILFDYFETPIKRTQHDKYDFKSLSDLIIKKIETYSPIRAKRYQSHFNSFIAESRFIEAGNLGTIFDSGRRVRDIPRGCKFRQIAIQKNIVFGKIRYLINKPLWDKLDTVNKIGLILHEVLYRELKHETSKDLRLFNAWIMNTLFQEVPITEYFKKLKETRFLWNTLYGIPVDLSLTKIKNSKIISLTTYENILFDLLNNKVKSTRHFLNYYPNGQVKRLSIRGSFQFQTNFGTLKSRRDRNDIQFHINGSLQSLTMTNSQIESDDFIINICVDKTQKNCRLIFHKNQEIHIIESATIINKNNGESFEAKTVKLTEEGHIYEIN